MLHYEGGSDEVKNGKIPSHITLANCTAHADHNEQWNRVGDVNGRPQYARQGNPDDKIYWDGRQWGSRWGNHPRFFYVCEQDTPLPPKQGWRNEDAVGVPPTIHYDGGFDLELDLQKVAENPSAYKLILEGHHDHPDCNGTYTHDGEENGKPKWAKSGTNMKLFWTGRSWDVYWGGFSPEAVNDTPVPPTTGYDNDKGNCDIRVSYEESR